jgi:hypothetical protein
VGYLCSRVLKQIDPKVGIACGLTIGAIRGLFFSPEGANRSSTIVGIAGMIFVPFQVCQKLNFPVTFKTALAVTGIVLSGDTLRTMINSRLTRD